MTWKDLRHVLCFGACLAGLMLAIAFPVGCSHGTITTPADAFEALCFSLGIGAIVPVVLAPALAVRLRVAEGNVTQLVFGKERRTRPLHELCEVTLQSGTFPVVLTFQDGTRMRLLGSHIAERAALVDFLRESVPDLLVHGGDWVERGSSAAWKRALTRRGRSAQRG